MKDAQEKALAEYEKFNERRLAEDAARAADEFEQQVKQIENKIK